MSKSNAPIKSKSIIKHLRFELSVKEHQSFYYVGQEILKLRTKKEILLELIKIAKEKYPDE